MSNPTPGIDFVLAFEDEENDKHQKRLRFQNCLKEIGLILYEEKFDDIQFVQVYLPDNVLCEYADILKLHAPLLSKDENEEIEQSKIRKVYNSVLNLFQIETSSSNNYPTTAEFSKKRSFLFDTNELINNTQNRIIITSFILERNYEESAGIRSLLAEKVYTAAYPLHDGASDDGGSQRGALLNNWALLSNWRRYQPLDEIKDYFGARIALYFTWLGYYNTMLIIPSIIGIISILYGIITVNSDDLSNDICSKNITMCPLCSKNCHFWNLQDTCTYSKLSYIIDNPVTIANCVFMSIWAAVYLELWQRYCSKSIHKWGLANFKEANEPDRPEYVEENDDKKRLSRFAFTYAMVMLMLLLTIAAVLSIIIYRTALITTKLISNTELHLFIIPISADILNLIVITILNTYYIKVATWLTNLENHRTLREYEESITLKTYLFKFVNYYAPVSYLAFFKGKFVGYPAKYNRIFGYRQEQCQPGGCLIELSVQLAVIMIGGRIIDLIIENLIPYLQKRKNEKHISFSGNLNPCLDNYKLVETNSDVLFDEYLAMIVQYGFISLFIMAFPLAPLLAFINNTFEMRLDAQKFVKFYRRPVPQRVKDIGVWLRILELISSLSIASNAFIIAFSSNFIPKLIYSLKLNPDKSYEGYLEFALAYFDVSDFQEGMGPDLNPNNVTTCRYLEFRNPPDHPKKYKRPLHYWHIMTVRLAFILMYNNVIRVTAWCIKRTIPELPQKVEKKIKENTRTMEEEIISTENYNLRRHLIESA